jgi:hypothetical protein
MLTVYLSLVHIVAVMEHAFIIIVFPLNVLVVAVLFLIPNIQHAPVVLALLTILLVAHVKEEGNSFLLEILPAADLLAHD